MLPCERRVRSALNASALAIGTLVVAAGLSEAQAPATIQQAILNEPNQRSTEVSTEELTQILAARTVAVFDARPFREFAVSHIPGARNVGAKPGVPMSDYVSDVVEIGRTVGGDKKTPMILAQPRRSPRPLARMVVHPVRIQRRDGISRFPGFWVWAPDAACAMRRVRDE